MKWRIVAGVLSLVPIVLEALRDGKVTEDEAAELAAALVSVVSALK